MHDANGKPLNVGDRVNIPCVITGLSPGDDLCNVTLESIHGRRPDGYKETIGGINTGVLEKVGEQGEGPDYPDRLMKFFEYSHLPQELQAVSRRFYTLADFIASSIEPGAERTVALRKLLESKDAAVRAALHKGN